MLDRKMFYATQLKLLKNSVFLVVSYNDKAYHEGCEKKGYE